MTNGLSSLPRTLTPPDIFPEANVTITNEEIHSIIVCLQLIISVTPSEHIKTLYG